MAAYRDADGRLHAVSGRFTRLGCLVVWNAAERTWDCPCHGSCYRHDGKVIQGLALADLQPKHSGGGAALAGVLASHRPVRQQPDGGRPPRA